MSNPVSYSTKIDGKKYTLEIWDVDNDGNVGREDKITLIQPNGDRIDVSEDWGKQFKKEYSLSSTNLGPAQFLDRADEFLKNRLAPQMSKAQEIGTRVQGFGEEGGLLYTEANTSYESLDPNTRGQVKISFKNGYKVSPKTKEGQEKINKLLHDILTMGPSSGYIVAYNSSTKERWIVRVSDIEISGAGREGIIKFLNNNKQKISGPPI